MGLCSPEPHTCSRPCCLPWAADFSKPGEEPNHSRTRAVKHSQGFVGVFDNWSGFNYEPTLQQHVCDGLGKHEEHKPVLGLSWGEACAGWGSSARTLGFEV